VPKVLDCLRSAGVDYAILHGVDRVLSQSVVSDIDVVVGPPPERVIRQASRCLEGEGLVPIMEWPYDVGRTRTVFLATLDGREAVQLDMLHDRWAFGKYAVKSGVLLERSEVRNGVSVVAPIDELVYLLRKRMVKGDVAATTDLRARSSQFTPTALDEAIRSSLSPYGRRSVAASLRGDAGWRRLRPINWIMNLGRQVRRVAQPTGYWVHCSSPETAEAVVERFGSYLPHAVSLDSLNSPAAITRLILTRLRPGIVITHGARPPLLKPDTVIESGSPDDACRRLVAAFRVRTERRLGVA
jgi:hypothetical protein